MNLETAENKLRGTSPPDQDTALSCCELKPEANVISLKVNIEPDELQVGQSRVAPTESDPQLVLQSIEALATPARRREQIASVSQKCQHASHRGILQPSLVASQVTKLHKYVHAFLY